MDKFKADSRIFIPADSKWTDETPNIIGWTGVVLDTALFGGYTVSLDNDPGQYFFMENELADLAEYDEWVAAVISGEIDVPWFAK